MRLNQKLLTRILTVFAFLLILALILAVPAFHYGKELAHDYLLKQSREYSEEGQADLAFQKAYRASRLFPDSEEAKVLLARSTLEYPHRNQSLFWNAIIDSPERTPEDLKNYVNSLLDSFQYKKAERLIPRLFKELPDDDEVQTLYTQYLLRKKDYAEIIEVVPGLIKKGHESTELWNSLYIALSTIGSEEARISAARLMLQNARRKDSIGADAATRLLNLDVVREEVAVEIARNLLENPSSSKEDRLLALRFLSSVDSANSVPIEKYLVEFFSPETSDEDLLLLCRYYASMNDFEEILSLAPESRFFQSREISQIYHQALIESGQVQKAFDHSLRMDPDPGLNSLDRLLIRAQALLAMGRQEEFNETLDIAVEEASLSQFSELEELIFKFENWKIADRLYERLLDIEGLESIGLQKMVWSKYLQGDEFELLQYLRQVDLSDYTEEPAILAFLIYVKLLFQQDVMDSRFHLERLIAEYPQTADFKFVQAFSLLQDRKPELAWELIAEHLNIAVNQGNRYQRFILYLTARRIGFEGNLRPVEDYLYSQNILPSEKRLLSYFERI